MLLPLNDCLIQKKLTRDVYGETVFGAPVKEKCSIIQVKLIGEPTTVRADSSASRGYADEFILKNHILLTPNTIARIGDLIEVVTFKIEITGLLPKFDVWGKLDHYVVDGKIWVAS